MNYYENSDEKHIIKKIKDLISFEQKMSTQTKKGDNSENYLGYRIVISCSCQRSEFSLKNFSIEKKGLIRKREKVLLSFNEERG